MFSVRYFQNLTLYRLQVHALIRPLKYNEVLSALLRTLNGAQTTLVT